MLRRALVVCLLLACCAILYACGRDRTAAPGDRVTLRLMNTVEDQIAVLTVSWWEPGKTIASTAVEVAGGGKALAAGAYAFALTRDEAEQAALDRLTVTVSVADRGGATQTLDSLTLPSAWGDTHACMLGYENGRYWVKECQEDGSSL
ncbi:MAG: hypothetical protein ACI4ML_01945 [Aristaeellaceae bacterium]